MQNKWLHRAKLNMLSTLLRQLMATVCGIIIPRVMIGAFGSVVYGATTSIAQFLSYISLLEGGIGRVARGALYKPLAEKDSVQISGVYKAIKSFFRNVGIVFVVYTVVLALLYYDIAGIQTFSRKYTAGLVFAISLSTMATYFGGIANMTLMHADQKQYLTNTIITITNLLNTLLVVVLVWTGSDVLSVKLVSSIVFIIRPVLYATHVKKHYKLEKVEKNNTALEQKWTGIGQHIAYFLHTNTDIVMLTLLADLKTVAVYSVYHLVVFSVWNIASSFSGGMEAALGAMIAKKEQVALCGAYRYYKCILTFVTILLFGSTGVLIVPFIKLYMSGITDANYTQPIFALVLILAEAMNTFALPCTTLPISANCLKQTKLGSYSEAVINICVSLALIRWNPLLGVAIGTASAVFIKSIFYMCYAAKNILHVSREKLILQFSGNVLLLTVITVGGMKLMSMFEISNFYAWFAVAFIVFLLLLPVAVMACWISYPQEVDTVMKKLRRVSNYK